MNEEIKLVKAYNPDFGIVKVKWKNFKLFTNITI